MKGHIHIELEVRGMTCEHCVQRVTHALASVPGVIEADVPGWRSNRASVIAAPDVDVAALVEAAAKAGYRARVMARRGETEPVADSGAGPLDFDLLVIGGGSAGFGAAIKGAEEGANVALVEAGTIGGTCVNRGCVPSKTLLRAAGLNHLLGHHPFHGVPALRANGDWAAAVTQKDELVDELRQAKYWDVLDAYSQITYIQGRARLTGGSGVEITPSDGGEPRSYAPDKIVIATGASPWTPPIPGLEKAGCLTSTTAMEMTQRPATLVVLGGSAVGLELAQIFARFGAKVTVLELLPRVAPFEEPEISQALADYLRDEGLEVFTETETQRVDRGPNGYRLETEVAGEPRTFTAERLLVATGRRANTAGMGLEEAGVGLDEKGAVQVDKHLQTSSPEVYAAGDCTDHPRFVYVAAYGGGLAAENALNGDGRAADFTALPRVTFTDPAVAAVGLTEEEARERGYAVKATTIGMENVPRALANRDTRGLIKLVADAETDRLLGAHVLAPEAGEVVQTAVLAIKFGLTVNDLRETLFPYLTQVEGLKLAALTFEKDVERLSCCAG